MALPSVRALTLTPFYLSVLLNGRITMMRRLSSSRSRRRITLIIMIVSVLLSLSDCVLFVWCPGAMVAKECWVLLPSRRLPSPSTFRHDRSRHPNVVSVTSTPRIIRPRRLLLLFASWPPLFPIRTTNQPFHHGHGSYHPRTHYPYASPPFPSTPD